MSVTLVPPGTYVRFKGEEHKHYVVAITEDGSLLTEDLTRVTRLARLDGNGREGYIELPVRNPAIPAPTGMTLGGDPVVALEIDYEFPDTTILHVVKNGSLERVKLEESEGDLAVGA